MRRELQSANSPTQVAVFASMLLWLTLPTVAAQEDPGPTPPEDDANLNDIAFVDSQTGWAVGDRGVVWNTVDGGRSWVFRRLPGECSLRSVCFLTDRMGWVAGAATAHYAGLRYGVLFVTRDGGSTWTRLHAEESRLQMTEGAAGAPVAADSAWLPALHFVQFIDREFGFAAGERTGEFPTGVLSTVDGGRTWQSVPGPALSDWRAADFVHSGSMPPIGVVAGRKGRTALVGGDRLLESVFATRGQRGLFGVKLDSDETGWIVGDGSLVRHTQTGGVVWTEPAGTLPTQLRDFFDFRAVASHGRQVWIAGDPGSVVWHSSDGGHCWVARPTGHSVPIRKLCFTGERIGWAAGDLGCILKTEDGGETWKAVRGGRRRAAFLVFCARPRRLPLNLLALTAGESGYRGVVVLPSRRDTAADSIDTALDLRLHDAALATGAAGAVVDWRFPVTVPDIERAREGLVAEWNRRLDGRLADVLAGRLVCQLRTWRPDVVVLDAESPGDAATELLNLAVLRAVEAASDPSQFPTHRQLAHLEPWRIKRVFRRLPDNSHGDIEIDPFDYLPRSGKHVHVLAAAAGRILYGGDAPGVSRESLRLLRSHGDGDALHDLFSGLAIPPDSEARRDSLPFDESQLEFGRKLARRQRNLRARADRYFDDPSLAAAGLAELRSSTDSLPPEQASLHLWDIANQYRLRDQWDLFAATLEELVRRYPAQPESAEAMRWLLFHRSGAEPAWQRVRRTVVRGRNSESRAAGHGVLQTGVILSQGRKMRQQAIHDSYRSGAQAASLMREHWPRLFQESQIRFAVASLLRKRGAGGAARGLYAQSIHAGSLWTQTAHAELWMLAPTGAAPKPLVICRRTHQRPHLDAVLSEDCWQQAAEIQLRNADESDAAAFSPRAILMLARDDSYLYLASSFPRHPAVQRDGPGSAVRSHDESLEGFDRLILRIDTDRDYATWYTFGIDQRGCTTDACCENRSWNPTWYVAADADSERWRVEAAIPFDALVPDSPAPNAVWAMDLSRTIPAVRVESWTRAVSDRAQPERFGLLRFE